MSFLWGYHLNEETKDIISIVLAALYSHDKGFKAWPSFLSRTRLNDLYLSGVQRYPSVFPQPELNVFPSYLHRISLIMFCVHTH